MAISQATADGHATEIRQREEADRNRSQGDVAVDVAAGSDDGRTVLAGVCAQPGVDHAPTDGQRGQTLQPLLVPAEAYPPAGSAGSPINVDGDEYYTPDVISTSGRCSSASVPGSSSTHYDLNFIKSHTPISTRANSRHIPDGPIAHSCLCFAIPVGDETPPLCHTDGSTMHHHETWGLRDVPAASPNYAPSKDRLDVVPAGFVRNEGPGKINFPITDLQGLTQQPDYIQVVMIYNPFVLAIVRDNPYLYGQALHIEPRTDKAQRPRYDPSDLLIFKTYDSHRATTDELVCSLEDESAVAEVHRWRRLMSERAKLERDMQRVLQSVHDVGMEQERIQVRMESANLLARIEFARELRRPRRGRRS